MTSQQRINAFVQFGLLLESKIIAKQEDEKLQELYIKARHSNGWFTHEEVTRALRGISTMLREETLRLFCATYSLPESFTNRTVAVIMAGNIPAVNFADILYCLLSGFGVRGKLSSSDPYTVPYLLELLNEVSPELAGKVIIAPDKLSGFDIVLATGSNNSARYFEYYFGKYPHVIRKNRTSAAIIDGFESKEDLQKLGEDIFSYYGLGCRSVNKLFIKQGLSPESIADALQSFEYISDHSKYRNNYDYYKSIYLLNKESFLDTGFLIMKESESLHPPVSVLFFEYYENEFALRKRLDDLREELQCLVSRSGENETLVFGKSQQPNAGDYPDGVDVVSFLLSLD
jgi:hypothetical protein